jgi:hypothetical protein
VQERHSVQRSEADRYAAAAVAYPLPPVAAGAAQFESAGRLQAAVLRRRAVAVPVPAHFSAEAVPAHFFAEAAALVPCSAQPKAQRSAAPEALAEQAVAPRPEESAARHAAAEPPRAAGHAGVVAPEAVRDAAEVPRPEAPGVRVQAPARPSVVLSVFRRDRLHRRPAPSPAARFARARARL